MFGTTAVDAVLGGLATAFFGSLVAGGAYLLRQNLALTVQLQDLRRDLAALREGQLAMHRLGTAYLPETSMEAGTASGGDDPATQ